VFAVAVTMPQAVEEVGGVVARGPRFGLAATMPAATATTNPAICSRVPAKPPNAPGSLSWGVKPLPAIVAITPPIEMKTAVTRPTTGAQRHGPQATTAAAPSEMIGPGGIVG